ncbi:unnamed protein product [Ixodes hexagonus]
MVLQNSGRFKFDKAGKSGEDGKTTTRDDTSERRLLESLFNDELDAKFGFKRHQEGTERIGWLINIHPTEILNEDKRLISAVDYYFIEEDGSRFKASLPYEPYFYVAAKPGAEQEVISFLTRKYQGTIVRVEQVPKEDLDLPNHLVGLKRTYLKLLFLSVNDLIKVRKELLPAVRKNQERQNTSFTRALGPQLRNGAEPTAASKKMMEQTENIVDIREHDVPYHIRVSIDLKIFVGLWYAVRGRGVEAPDIKKREDILIVPDVTVLAYDIETTKLPLKFPDSATDQIMMISYMVDGQGYLITNREIVSADVEDFEYTPKPEFEGPFIVFNEPNELSLIQKFFDHIIEVKPLVIATYNGDNFDWQARAAVHGLDMSKEVGYSRSREGYYLSRPSAHMDCFHWVRRDSYLPVGSQNLKAVAKRALMSRPDYVRRKVTQLFRAPGPYLDSMSLVDAPASHFQDIDGGTKVTISLFYALLSFRKSPQLGYALLVASFKTAIGTWPIKPLIKKLADFLLISQHTVTFTPHLMSAEPHKYTVKMASRYLLFPLSARELLDSQTYTCANSPLRKNLGSNADFIGTKDICRQNSGGFLCPARRSIAELLKVKLDPHWSLPGSQTDNGMPRQHMPSRGINVSPVWQTAHGFPNFLCVCAVPASRAEFQRIQQQLETERFPPAQPGLPQRAFHELPREERAAVEKKRLADYCRKAYKKVHITRTEVRETTICQKENSFYVDTVRNFRDRRYEFKALLKVAKRKVAEAVEKGDAAEIKAAKNLEVLYDSLQLAHKCILNSFYGYVMRKGARWYSMEMAGIVCHTGAGIITHARELVEQVGRPLELDTDGIWCVLPASFPENFVIHTSNAKKPKLTISYPGAVLNIMVQVGTLSAHASLLQLISRNSTLNSEHSIYEIEGSSRFYSLNSRRLRYNRVRLYTVISRSNAHLFSRDNWRKKRDGRSSKIRIFFYKKLAISTLAHANLGTDVANAGTEVANTGTDVVNAGTDVANARTDVANAGTNVANVGTDAANTGTDVATQKPTSPMRGPMLRMQEPMLPTQEPMSRRQEPIQHTQADVLSEDNESASTLETCKVCGGGSPGTHFWDKAGGFTPTRLLRHPAHLVEISGGNQCRERRKRCRRIGKQCHINLARWPQTDDIEDLGEPARPTSGSRPVVATVTHRKRARSPVERRHDDELRKSWRETLGPPPLLGDSREERVAWLQFHKKKWELQRKQRQARGKRLNRESAPSTSGAKASASSGAIIRAGGTATLGGFLRKAQRTLLDSPWQIIQLAGTGQPGVFRLWVLVGSELHQVRLMVPRIFYVNSKVPKEEENLTWRKVMRHLPRSHPVYHLYEYSIDESIFQQRSEDIMQELSAPHIEGIYETQVPLDFRVMVQLGCVCLVSKQSYREYASKETDTFNFRHLEFGTLAQHEYLEPGTLKYIYLYHHAESQKMMFGMFLPPTKRAVVFVVDTVRSNQMPNVSTLYKNERQAKISRGTAAELLPEEGYVFEVRVETDVRSVHRAIQRNLSLYRDEKRGPTMLAVQSCLGQSPQSSLLWHLPFWAVGNAHVHREIEFGAKASRFMGAGSVLVYGFGFTGSCCCTYGVHCFRCAFISCGAVMPMCAMFGCRSGSESSAQKEQHRAKDSDTLSAESDNATVLSAESDTASAVEVNNPGAYSAVCVELDLNGLAVTTILQSQNLTELEGVSSSVAFDAGGAACLSLDSMVGGGQQASASSLASYDDVALSASAFRVLRTMVAGWLRDVAVYRNVFADFQLAHLFRWLKSSQSLLYEPVLKRILNNLMKKMFLQLVGEFERLGTVVVYGSTGRLVVCTKRRRLQDGLAHVEYVINGVRGKDLFHSLDLTPRTAWHFLLWMDPADHGGVQGKQDSPEGEEEQEEAEVRMLWNLARFLPEAGAVQENFNMVIGGYINSVYLQLKQELEAPGSSQVQRRTISQAPKEQSVGSETATYMKQLVSGELAQRLFGITQKIQQKLPSNLLDGENVFPTIPGCHLSQTSPALEFVKAVCQVLSLDGNITDEVTKLRRDLLRLIGVGEFSDQAMWKDPCLSFILTEVICKACNNCRDLDLCKDPYQGLDSHGMYVLHILSCLDCYIKSYCELLFAQSKYQLSGASNSWEYDCFNLQIKRSNMMKYCECAGPFQPLLSPEDLERKFNTFLNIAKHFHLSLLEESITWILKHK